MSDKNIDGIPLAAGVSPDDDWIQTHSVTCAICGGYADERSTVDLWNKSQYPDGEAHSNCYEYAREKGITFAMNNLNPIVTPH